MPGPLAYAEVLGVPYAAWVAPVGTVFPKVDVAPAVAWKEFGTNGVDNQGTNGVTTNLAETISSFKPGGKTLKIKDWRTEEDITVQFGIVDLTVETLSQILDDTAITTTAAATGVAGEKSISLVRGVPVAYYALLLRGLSPYDDGTGFVAQWEFTRVCQTGSQAINYVPGTPAEAACEFSVRGDVGTNDPAVYRAQTAAAL